MPAIEEQLEILSSGTDKIVPDKLLVGKLGLDRPLKVKLGVDPTSSDIHIGHAVSLRKMRQFQELGHEGVLIIGDGTAAIGDPSGRNSTRPQLSQGEIAYNAATYVDQAMKVLIPERTTILHNSEWLGKLGFAELLELAGKFTVARILERDDFKNRYESELPISLHEFLYPVMQAYDSVVIEADVELGGSDQLFNLLAGRELMEKLGMEPQVCMTLPLLVGTDGKKKMSKTYGNYIGVDDEPADMFGKAMSVPDSAMGEYFRLASSFSLDKIAELEGDGIEPVDAKRALAFDIVETYYDTATAEAARDAFDSVFRNREKITDAPVFEVPLSMNGDGLVYLARLLHEAGLAASASEGRRHIDAGAVKVDGKAVEPKRYNVKPEELSGKVVQVGKRNAVKVVWKG